MEKKLALIIIVAALAGCQPSTQHRVGETSTPAAQEEVGPEAGPLQEREREDASSAPVEGEPNVGAANDTGPRRLDFAPTTKLPGWYGDLIEAHVSKIPSDPYRVDPEVGARLLRSFAYPDITKATLLRISFEPRQGSKLSSSVVWHLPAPIRGEPANLWDEPRPVRLLGSFLETASFREAFGNPTVWHVPEGEPGWSEKALALDDLTSGQGALPPGVEAAPISFEAVADQLLAADLERSTPINGQSELAEHRRLDGLYSFSDTAHLFAGFSIAAAQLGDRQRAEALFEKAVEMDQRIIGDLAWDYSWRLFSRGITALHQQGHAAAIPLFEKVSRDFPGTKHAEQSAELLRACRRSLESLGGDHSRSEIQRSIDELVELSSLQSSDPGGPTLFGTSRESQPTDELAKLGPAAIPELIAVLDDTRATRAIYWHRRFFPNRHVVRVSDAAIGVIQSIIGRDFYRRSCTGCYLQTEQPGARQQVRQRVAEFWEVHGTAPGAAEWVVPRLSRACGKSILGGNRESVCFTVGDTKATRLAITRWGVKTLGYEAMSKTLRNLVAAGPYHYVPMTARVMLENGDESALGPLQRLLSSRHKGTSAQIEAMDILLHEAGEQSRAKALRRLGGSEELLLFLETDGREEDRELLIPFLDDCVPVKMRAEERRRCDIAAAGVGRLIGADRAPEPAADEATRERYRLEIESRLSGGRAGSGEH